MASFRLSIWPLLVLVGLALSQNVPVSPSNTSTYNPNAYANESAVMVTSQLQNPVQLQPLTHDALSVLTGKILSSNDGIDIVDVTQNATHIVSDEFVYISCDPDAWPGDVSFGSVVNKAIDTNVSAIIFYSLHEPFCHLDGSLPNDYQIAYSTVNTANASTVMQHLTGMFGTSEAQAMLLTQAEYNNAVASNNDGSGIGGSSPSTAVAMIILYSITGIITALFLLIIVTGAVRAHRHPERYGPRNVLGRPRQGRAKGIARAMLDTIPIVKFNREEEKTNDVEMAGTRPAAESDQADSDGQAREGAEHHNPESSRENPDTNANVDGVTPAIQEMPDVEKNGDNSLGCSICTEDFEEGQDLRVLPCKHRFHPACVDPWLLDVSGTCPLCRVDLRPAASTEAGTEGAEGESALPPPLDPTGARGGPRRRTIVSFFDRRRLNASTREERLAAIRNYRNEQQSREPMQNESAQETEQNENEGRWRRVRRSLRLGGGQTNSMVEPNPPEVQS
ncbi:MAG: hypothetical protein M1828_005802 [Chrysothrix sp. TS-e1954]|nr:MAG: hypothetical protein M1828_005802 [Chrysothrix sp. TS-e1954]